MSDPLPLAVRLARASIRGALAGVFPLSMVVPVFLGLADDFARGIAGLPTRRLPTSELLALALSPICVGAALEMVDAASRRARSEVASGAIRLVLGLLVPIAAVGPFFSFGYLLDSARLPDFEVLLTVCGITGVALAVGLAAAGRPGAGLATRGRRYATMAIVAALVLTLIATLWKGGMSDAGVCSAMCVSFSSAVSLWFGHAVTRKIARRILALPRR